MEGDSSSFKNLGGRGGGCQRTVPSVGGVRIFSGITQYITISNHMYFFFSSVLILFMAQSGARMPRKITNSL